jgi:RNA polymerase sigma factor (sigma-70 family)
VLRRRRRVPLNKPVARTVIGLMSQDSTLLVEIENIYRSRGADFFRLALAKTSDPEAARDAVQDGFARAIRGRRSFRGSGSLEAWVARCVINAAHEVRRARQIDVEPDDFATTGGGSGVESAALHADAAIVREAVRQLPPRQRDALYLRFYLGFEYAAIAETLGIEVGTVSATLHAARGSLAQTLQEVLR